MKLNVCPEMCCEECGNVIHNHFDCPCCGKKGVGTDALCDLTMVFDGSTEKVVTSETIHKVEEIACENCGATFRLVGLNDFIEDWEWEMVSKGKGGCPTLTI